MSDINFNSTECLVTTMNFGETIVNNICSGAVTRVPWGTIDWLGAGVLGVMALIFVALFAGLAFMLFSDF